MADIVVCDCCFVIHVAVLVMVSMRVFFAADVSLAVSLFRVR